MEQGYAAEAIPETDSKERSSFRLAGFWIRLLAYIVDLVIVGAISHLITNVLYSLFNVENGWPLLTVSFSYIGLWGSLYFILMTKWMGQTVGKMLFGLKVVRQDGAPLDWATIVFREGVGRFIAHYVFLIGFLWAAFHPRKKGWHDLIADTYVVYDQAEEERLRVTVQSSV